MRLSLIVSACPPYPETLGRVRQATRPGLRDVPAFSTGFP